MRDLSWQYERSSSTHYSQSNAGRAVSTATRVMTPNDLWKVTLWLSIIWTVNGKKYQNNLFVAKNIVIRCPNYKMNRQIKSPCWLNETEIVDYSRCCLVSGLCSTPICSGNCWGGVTRKEQVLLVGGAKKQPLPALHLKNQKCQCPAMMLVTPVRSAGGHVAVASSTAGRVITNSSTVN